ncbi:MAG: beta-lactamase family protein [Oscillospiraceae bacterium]|nr:beta-lactamase family protein [Oscillospiraceae bacterium]
MANFKQLDELLRGFAGKTVPGCGCAVAKNGEILYEGYYGMADIEAGKPVTPDTIYRLFSMTKVIICTAAMMQFERGKFLLNEPFYEYFPEYRHTKVFEMEPNGNFHVRDAKCPMLVRDTFNMAVGLPYPGKQHPTDIMMNEVRARLDKEKNGKYTLQDDVRAMGEVPVRFDPGTHWLYGFGHEMVAAMIEVTSGMTVGEFLKKEIFEPLGMTSTGYRFFGDTRERMITMYRPEDGVFKRGDGFFDARHEPDAVYEAGGAGLFSTVRDYTKFAQMLANGGVYNGQQIIGRKTIDLMRRNMLSPEMLKDFNNPYLEGYGSGLGVRTMMEPAGVTNMSVGEFGWTGAAGTWASIDPSEGVSVIYMHQTMPNNEYYHHHRVRSIAYGCL